MFLFLHKKFTGSVSQIKSNRVIIFYENYLMINNNVNTRIFLT